MQRFIDAANALTIASLLAAFGGVLLHAINGQTGLALVALIVSGIIDLFDGLVARRLIRDEQQKKFGGVLDSLVDGCAFGFAPSIMLYCTGMNTLAEVAVLVALPVCVVWRVAYFEVVGFQTERASAQSDGGGPRYYTGLPATYVALALPAAALLGLLGETWFRWGSAATVALLCLAMVSTFRVRKPGASTYAVFVALAIAAIAVLSIYGAQLPGHGPNRDSDALNASDSVNGPPITLNSNELNLLDSPQDTTPVIATAGRRAGK